MNFKEIIKQEWEKEFLTAESQEPYEIEDSLFSVYHELVERICVTVWNQALEQAMNNARMVFAEVDVEGVTHSEPVDIDYSSISKLMINEQGTDTTQV